MYLVYAPADGERQEWWFDPARVTAQEAEAIERRTGWDWSEFGQHLLQGSVKARRALLWTFQRQVHHTLRFEDVSFMVGEVELEYSRDELGRIRDGIQASDAMTDAEKAQRLAALDAEMENAKDAPGKAPASNAG